MKHEIIGQVFEDYKTHIMKMENINYSAIYLLTEKFESYWNGSGANLKYDMDIKNGYLYLENAKICPTFQLIYCEIQSDSLIFHLMGNKLLYIVIQWVQGTDAFITQIYIQNPEDEDDFKMLYEK